MVYFLFLSKHVLKQGNNYVILISNVSIFITSNLFSANNNLI